MIKGIDYTGMGITFFCHDGSGKYVLHKRTNKCRDEHGCWDFGGGGVKHGETLEQALFREVVEEYTTPPIKYAHIGFRELHRMHEDKKTHWIMFDFKVLVDPKSVAIGEPEKSSGLGWFTLDSLPSPLHSAITNALEKNKAFL
jgi:8-oxo-dGTP diphosphatase